MTGTAGVNFQHFGRTSEAGDHRDVTYEIEIEIGVERRVDGVARDGSEQRIAVWLRVGHGLGGDIGGGARPVFDYKGLPEPFREPLANQSRENVRWPPAENPTIICTGRVG